MHWASNPEAQPKWKCRPRLETILYIPKARTGGADVSIPVTAAATGHSLLLAAPCPRVAAVCRPTGQDRPSRPCKVPITRYYELPARAAIRAGCWKTQASLCVPQLPATGSGEESERVLMNNCEPRRPACILVVDDNDEVLRVLKGALVRFGHQVKLARSAEEALAAIGRGRRRTGVLRPDLVLLDLVMDGMGGLGFLQRLRALRTPPPVLVVSGHATVPLAVEAMRLGALGVIEKPLKLKTLHDEVQRAIDPSLDPFLAALTHDLSSVRTREDAARIIGVDPKTISNRLRRLTRMGFREFMRSRRTAEARRLLAGTQLEAKEVSRQVGFGSYRNFARVFRQQTGLSPVQYRSHLRHSRHPLPQ